MGNSVYLLLHKPFFYDYNTLKRQPWNARCLGWRMRRKLFRKVLRHATSVTGQRDHGCVALCQLVLASADSAVV